MHEVMSYVGDAGGSLRFDPTWPIGQVGWSISRKMSPSFLENNDKAWPAVGSGGAPLASLR